MTTLLVTGGDPFNPAPSSAPSNVLAFDLHAWLQGNWAMLFSNPDDFAPHASTPYGFMACLADEFHRARTKPLAVINRLQDRASSWLDHASTDHSLVVLERATANHRVIDFTTRALALKLMQLEPPYVLILDERGRCRSTIKYQRRRVERLRTVQDLLNVVAALRGGSTVGASGRPSPGQAGTRFTREGSAGTTP